LHEYDKELARVRQLLSRFPNEIAPKPVTDLIRPEPKPLYALQALDEGGEAGTFHATDDHPWKVEGKGWVETADLRPGEGEPS
jgi:hypothetical protein